MTTTTTTAMALHLLGRMSGTVEAATVNICGHNIRYGFDTAADLEAARELLALPAHTARTFGDISDVVLQYHGTVEDVEDVEVTLIGPAAVRLVLLVGSAS